MQECQTPGVSGFRALRTWQAKRAKMMGFAPTHHTTALNNEYYANHPAELFQFNLSNPLIRPHMCLYPEATGSVSEFFHTNRMLAMDDASLDLGQLMWAEWKKAPHRHFYIKELARLHDGNFIIPLRWITVNGIESFDGLSVTYDSTVSYCDDESSYLMWLVGVALSWAASMPHPIQEIANNIPTITVRMMPWSDDVSGNRTKQYNTHTNVYMANTNLPHAKLQQEYFIQFVSTSQYASSSEQMRVIAENTGPGIWHKAYNCVLEQEVLFQIIPHILPADNPQQAEHCSHMTGKGSRPCRHCEIGRSAVECEQDEMYGLFFSGGPEHTVAKTIQDIREQLLTACLGVQDAVEQLQTKTGIEQLIPKARDLQSIRMSHPETRDAQLRNLLLKGDQRKAVKNMIRTDIQAKLFQWLVEQPPHTYLKIPMTSTSRSNIRPGDHYNPLLDVPGLDVHQDTPCEILHTYLLSVDKYIWHKTNIEWDKKNEQLFAVRLRASAINGLTVTSTLDDFILRYPNSLLGKHFKILQQLAIFQLYDGVCPPLVFELRKATGELGAVLWFHKIANLNQYLEDLNVYIANLLDIWVAIDPNRIIVKQKLHILVHVIFECWNAIFRSCSVYSNHHGASFNLARRMAGIKLFKHQVSGGWWSQHNFHSTDCNTESQPQSRLSPDMESGPLPSLYMRAGENVRTFLQQHPALQRRLGWVSPLVLTPAALSKPLDCLWYNCKYLVARSRDICNDRTGIFYPGHIRKILSCPQEDRSVAIIDKYHINASRDAYFNMPVLYRMCDPEGQGLSVQIAVELVLFIFNAQHHCRACGCTRLKDQRIMQERKLTERTRSSLIHKPIECYLVNTHVLHNAALLREVLPRELTLPILYVANCEAHHKDRSAFMRFVGPLKRAGAQATAAETRARNKSGKDDGQKGAK
ncbi:hypothetical protein BC628DRAFT_1409428 [Trametes gibbosa]|nr:hypothetical protein BC628DRAFT_1409428 [Trametes gibbosa]